MDIILNLEHSERDFIKACVHKEHWAQKQLYETYYGKMMGVCLRYAKSEDESRDILHEGFIKVFKNIHRYKPGTSLNAWIHRIMVNTSIDYYRKLTRRRTEDIDTVRDQSSPEPDAVTQLSTQEILKAVQKLTPAYRTVFNLYVIEGYPHKEIAKQLKISESTSRSNLVKARSKLRDLLVSKEIAYEG